MGEPLVSVVTPVFNGADHIVECIESVLAQTYRNWNYVIVDNASTDATPDIAQRYLALDSRIRHLRFEEFVEATSNHNRAFDLASEDSDFCKVVQADDWLFPECLERMVAAAAQNPNVGMVGAYQLRGMSVDLTGLPHTTTVASGRRPPRVAARALQHHQATDRDDAALIVPARPTTILDRAVPSERGSGLLDAQQLRLRLRPPGADVSRPTGSRWRWSERMNSHDAENIVFLLRYGRAVVDGQAVLTEKEYRVCVPAPRFRLVARAAGRSALAAARSCVLRATPAQATSDPRRGER